MIIRKICLLIGVILILATGFSTADSTTDGIEPSAYVYEKTKHYNVYRLVANKERGYFFDAYFYLPDIIEETDRLIVEPINCGAGKSQDVYNQEALKYCVKGNSIGNDIARVLDFPFMTLAFPRPYSTYTHALSSDCMVATGEIKRIDEQFLKAIDDILEIIKEDFGIEIDRKIILLGYSAGGMFTSHFTLLHPDRVHIAVAGGNQGAFSTPLSSAKGHKLNFPLGTSDYYKLTGHFFNVEDWKSVHFLLVNGVRDTNDSINPKDCHPGDEPEIIKKVLGETMLERTKTSKKYYEENSSKAQFLLYSNSGHKWFYDDILNFISANLGTEFRTIESNHPLVSL